jgi:membrane protein YdbS with pleckstrin-like domain
MRNTGRRGKMESAHHLDPRVRLVWLMPTSVIILVVWLVGTAFSIISPESISHFSLGIPAILFPVALLLLLLIVLALPSFIWVHMNYVNFTYELASDEIVIREGVFTRKRTVIPYARIQNISTERTVLERVLGVATLNIETAGSNPGISEGILPGISHYEKLLGDIMEKVERSKSPHGGVGSMALERNEAGIDPRAQEQLLLEVRETNRLLREMLKEGRAHKPEGANSEKRHEIEPNYGEKRHAKAQ